MGDGAGLGAGRLAAAFLAGAFFAGAAAFFGAAFLAGAAFFAGPGVRPARFAVPAVDWEPCRTYVRPWCRGYRCPRP
ncbi:hypothetical protein DDE05_03940 [Streptomyces cavourensis]|nr:hypothetical protein DDE05_03940 [Streptomyces cavourensis]